MSSLDTTMAEGAGYRAPLRAYGRRRWLALGLVAGWPLVCAGLLWWSRAVVHWPVAALGLMLLWLVGAGAAVHWAGEFRCPRCRRRYGALGRGRLHGVTRGLFESACANCKLRKFAR